MNTRMRSPPLGVWRVAGQEPGGHLPRGVGGGKKDGDSRQVTRVGVIRSSPAGEGVGVQEPGVEVEAIRGIVIVEHVDIPVGEQAPCDQEIVRFVSGERLGGNAAPDASRT